MLTLVPVVRRGTYLNHNETLVPVVRPGIPVNHNETLVPVVRPAITHNHCGRPQARRGRLPRLGKGVLPHRLARPLTAELDEYEQRWQCVGGAKHRCSP